ncbi:MAG: MBOAT family protein, partial [Clostridia bacterium]|nr:MBOAT family protein [Clostridia bacterium]
DGKAAMYLSYYKVYLAAGVLCSFPIINKLREKIKPGEKLSKAFSVISGVILLALFIIAVSFAVKKAYNPFIYFNF